MWCSQCKGLPFFRVICCLYYQCRIDRFTTTFQTSWCNWRDKNLTHHVLCFTVKSVFCISPLRKTLLQIVQWHTNSLFCNWHCILYAFCKVYCNINLQYKSTKCTFSKLKFWYLIFYVFYMLWNRGFIFRKTVVYTDVV